MIKWI